MIRKWARNGLKPTRLQQLGFMFQFYFLLAEFSSLDNVLLPMRRLARPARRRPEAGRWIYTNSV